MAKIEKFEDLIVWQKARDLNKIVYGLSCNLQFGKDFGLRDQIRRSSISIMSNIAEGFERNGKGEFIQFLSIAKGSSGELRAQLYIAFDLNYIKEEDLIELNSAAIEVSKLLSGFINYLKQSELKGSKFSTN